MPKNDRRRGAPDYGVWEPDPTVFCGGDFRQHIDRSQSSEWLHPVATKTPPLIGFRVAVDLTSESVVKLEKYWPPDQLFVSQEIVRLRTVPPVEALPNGKLSIAVWLEMLVHADLMPYAVEWLDFEIERRATPKGEDINEFIARKIEDAGAEEGWQPVKLDHTLQLLEQTEYAPDPVAPQFIDSVLTMPIPKAVAGQWAAADDRGGLRSDLRKLEPSFQKPRLFRFIDFEAPHGSHYYRVRLKYRVPGVAPESVQTTGWYLSMEDVDIDFDSFDQIKRPELLPIIELKPMTATDAAASSTTPRRPDIRRPAEASIPAMP